MADTKDSIDQRQRARRHPMVLIGLAASAGLLCDRYWPWSVSPNIWWAIATVGWFSWYRCWRGKRDAAAQLFLLATIGFAMAGWHHHHWRMYPRHHISQYVVDDGEPAIVWGRVISVPDRTPSESQQPLSTIPRGVRSRFVARVSRTRCGSSWVEACGKLEIWVDGDLLGVGTGDEVELCGHLFGPPRALNPGQPDPAAADRGERILCRLSVPYPDCVQVRRHFDRMLTGLPAAVRDRGLRLLERYLDPPRSVLAGALLLGARDRLERERTLAFFRTGTIHLLAISGLHVGILAWFFFLVAKTSLRSRQQALLCLMLFTSAYCLVTGMRAPVLRATILVLIVCLGLFTRRAPVAFNALAAAAMVVLLVRPSELFRPGAQLSFLAVGTLIGLHKSVARETEHPLDLLIRRSRPWYQRAALRLGADLKRLWLAGLAIWLVTLPLVMHQFHLVSPVSLVLNVVLAIPIAVGLLSGFGVLLFGDLLAPLATACGAVCTLSLAFVETVVQWAERLPGSHWWVCGPTHGWCLLFYVALGLAVAFPERRPGRAWLIAGACLWFACPLGLRMARSLRTAAPDVLRCTFLSVGHGSCVVIETTHPRKAMIYDAGRMGIADRGVRIISEFLWYRGITHVDAIMLSHADADHYNAVPGLLERFSVGQVFVSPLMFRGHAPGLQVLQKCLASTELEEVWSGSVLSISPTTRAELLHPSAAGSDGGDNADSLVLELTHGSRKILLPGDLEGPGLDQLLAGPPRDCDVLMAPHHGSLRSEPERFSDWCTPEYVIISGGDDRGHDHQVEAYRAQADDVFHTADCGAVTVTIENDRLQVETFVLPE